MTVVDLKGKIMPTKEANRLSMNALVQACERRLAQNHDQVTVFEREAYAMDAPPDADTESVPLPKQHHLQLQQPVAEAVIAMHVEYQRARLLLEGIQNDMLMMLTRSESLITKTELIPIEQSIHHHLNAEIK